MEYEIYRTDDELYHHGIRGMRWGIRRYQNKDGSLTPRGKKRYDAELKKVREQEKVLKNRQATRAKIEKLEARKKAAAAEKEALDAAEGKTKKRKLFGRKEKAEKDVKKSVKDMSDVELFEAINRARMEDTYRQLRPEKVEKANPFGQMLNDIVKPAATNAGKQFLENALKKAGAKLLEDKVDPDSIEAMTKMRDKLKLKNEIDKLKKNEPEEKSAKDRLVETQAAKAQYEFEKMKKADAQAEAASASNAERERKNSNKYNKARTEFVSTASGNSTDASNRRTSSWERTASSVNDAVDWDSPAPSKSDTSTANRGKSYVSGLLATNRLQLRDSNPEPLATYDEDGRFIGYWSAIRGDSDGTF